MVVTKTNYWRVADHQAGAGDRDAIDDGHVGVGARYRGGGYRYDVLGKIQSCDRRIAVYSHNVPDQQEREHVVEVFRLVAGWFAARGYGNLLLHRQLRQVDSVLIIRGEVFDFDIYKDGWGAANFSKCWITSEGRLGGPPCVNVPELDRMGGMLSSPFRSRNCRDARATLADLAGLRIHIQLWC